MEQEKKIKYIGPSAYSDEDVEYELVLSGPIDYRKPDFIKDWEEKMDKYYAEVEKDKLVEDLNAAGFKILEK